MGVLQKSSSSCVRAMVSSRLSQNQKKKARVDKTEEEKSSI